MIKDIYGREISKILKISDKKLLDIFSGAKKAKKPAAGKRGARHRKRLIALDNRKYIYTSDLDVISMMLDSIKKPLSGRGI